MNKYEMDMTSGRIGLKLLKFSIPLMLSGILQLLYNAFDILAKAVKRRVPFAAAGQRAPLGGRGHGERKGNMALEPGFR